ncbi:MAG TPA: hypothetical protein VHQ20_01805, partial [Patescibacteria group bacterium]|nr:hypothetical protein [Patescibacteria group bacterium]
MDPNYIAGLNTISRQWNPNLIDHFYTNYPGETANGYVMEQSTWAVLNNQATGTIPLYRYWSGDITDHFYSTSAQTPNGYVSEGMIGFIFANEVPGAIPLYRLFRFIPGSTANGDHLYTTSTSERDNA